MGYRTRGERCGLPLTWLSAAGCRLEYTLAAGSRPLGNGAECHWFQIWSFLTISCSHKNRMMTSQTVQELSRSQTNKQTNTQTNKQTYPQTYTTENNHLHATAAWVVHTSVWLLADDGTLRLSAYLPLRNILTYLFTETTETAGSLPCILCGWSRRSSVEWWRLDDQVTASSAAHDSTKQVSRKWRSTM